MINRINTQGVLCQSEAGIFHKDVLNSNKCYLLDCDSELFVWMGRSTTVTERKTSIGAVEKFLGSQGRSTSTHLTFLTEGSETGFFKSYFSGWPQVEPQKLYEEGRGKVAAIFKQHGYDVPELPEEECEPFIDCSGTLKVWRVDGDEVFLLPIPEHKKLFSGDCYIVQYTYPNNDREDNLFYAWLGRMSLQEERKIAISKMNALVTSTKGDPVLAHIVEGKEPIQFFYIFQSLIVLKGGMSSCYKQYIAEKGIIDETYNDTKTALFRVQGTDSQNMQAIQVDKDSSSLNSSHCFILKTDKYIFTWVGNRSSTGDHDILDGMLDLINPTWQPILVREGNEPNNFWEALGGKAEYPREKEVKGFIEDPHLFTCSFGEGDLKVKEIFNFSQDDLTTEDLLILDYHSEIYAWIGRGSHIKSKQEALDIAMKFIEKDILVEGLSSETPVYVVTEGCEPPFFTRFFEWDSSKTNMLGNSFERKLAILKGEAQKLEAPLRNPWKAYTVETPDGSRSSPVGPNGLRRSTSPASNISGSSLKSLDDRRFSSPTPINRQLFPEPLSNYGDAVGSANIPQSNGSMQFDEIKPEANTLIYPYEQLKVGSGNPATDIDMTKREAYLSDEEFREKFGIPRSAFYALPRWKQNKLKMSLHLF